MEIHKKVWPQYFDAINSGKKNYELRLNDFEVKEGDVLILQEWDPQTQEYTGRSCRREVTYVAKCKLDELFWSKEQIEEKGIQIISIK
ncbi:DUF3850 domain-containing protein [Candidatus Nomurabacteria bacterium]|nr:DUF3850 domain-containing protein [Candidatus Nomurabacteria bacterium]